MMMHQYDDPIFFEEYAKMARSRKGLRGAGEWPQLSKLFPDPYGKVILDLGCGYGWHCAYAARRGADAVIGIDASARMIKEAKRRNRHRAIEYLHCPIEGYPFPGESFDLVFSNLVLHYLEDLRVIYRLIYGTLKPGGTFLFNIEHPTFTAGVNQQFSPDGTWPVADYFHPGQRTTDFLGHPVKKYHRTLTEILGELLKTGFLIEAVEEVIPPKQWQPEMPEELQRPMMLLVKARRPEGEG